MLTISAIWIVELSVIKISMDKLEEYLKTPQGLDLQRTNPFI